MGSKVKPTIFHFNCAVCGAHPPELDLASYLNCWRGASESRVRQLLSIEARILEVMARAPVKWQSKQLRLTLTTLADLLAPAGTQSIDCNPDHAPPIDSGFAPEPRHFLMDCPVCDTCSGVRPPDRYFSSWTSPCAVQFANMMYDTALVFYAVLNSFPLWLVPAEATRLRNIVAVSTEALARTSLRTCWFCGRRTTTLFGDGSPANPYRCRWCLDWSGGAFSGIKMGVKPAPMDSEFPFELDVAYDPPMPVRIGNGLIPWPELHRASLFQGNRVRHRPPTS